MGELWYIRNPLTDATKGPFEREDILQAWGTGDLGKDTEVRRGHEGTWVRLSELASAREPSENEPVRPRAVVDNPYAAPSRDDEERRALSASLTWPQILFSFSGRIPRRQYWATRAIAFLPFLVAGVFTALSNEERLAGLLIIPAYIFFLWVLLAGSVKRWHDLDKSGFWIFVAFVPIVGGFWEFFEAGCLRGTRGANKYGPDPT